MNQSRIEDPEVLDTQEIATAIIPLVIPCRELPKTMDPAIQELIAILAKQGIDITGPMFSFHHRRPSDTFDFELGFPVAHAIKPEGRAMNGQLPAVKVVRSVYKGPYEGLAQAWPALQKWILENGHSGQERFWESYLNNPHEVKSPDDYLTELNWIIG